MAFSRLLVDIPVALGAGGAVTLPHGLRVDIHDVRPTEVRPDRATPIAVTGVTATDVSFLNTDAGNPQTAVFRCEYTHTIQRSPIDIAPFLWQGGTGSGALSGLSWKQPVRAATTANIALAGLPVVDGVALVAGDRVLVKNQALAQSNGIYDAAAGAWTRSTDADGSFEVRAGLAVVVEEGTLQADTPWELTTNNPIVLGVTPLGFSPLDLSTTPPTTILPDAVAAVGTSPYAAHSDHGHAIATDVAVTISDSTNDEGVAATFSRGDHLHAHGIRGGGALHALVTAVVAGFMSAADKSKLDGITANAAPSVLGFGDGNVGAAAGTRFLEPWYGGALGLASMTLVEIVAPRPGTLRKLFMRHNTAAGNGNSVVYTVMLNGVATALTVTLATGAIGSASDLVNSVAVVQGDRIGLRASKAAVIAGGAVEAVGSMEYAA